MKKKLYDDQLIVITGAAGFIGSGVVRYLNDKGFNNLLLVDDLEQGAKWKNLIGKKYYDFIGINELFPWLVGREKDIEAFIHLGACSNTLETNGDYILENNYRYSVKIAEYALENNHRFIYASSAATYGNGSLGFSDDHDMIDKLEPLNLYGFSKQMFDMWAKEQGVLQKLVGLKYFNVYGPNEAHKGNMSSMVYKMYPSVVEKGVVSLFKSTEPDKYADGAQVRDFIYVKDAVKMTCNFLENDIGGIFNIGTGQATTWNALAKALFKAAKKPEKIEYIETPKSLAAQYQNYTKAEMAKYCKAFSLPGYVSLDYPLEKAVADYVTNYLSKDARW